MTRRSPYLTLFIALLSIGLVVALVTHPQISVQAAIRGLNIWWDVVFPALLPFVVVSEILMGVGVVHFVGVLLEPLMRPLFNVPGTGGFVLTMGFSSGYPVAAKITTSLREQGYISRVEGERLVSFTTTGDPLFVIGAVAVGFFNSEQLGFTLAATHYLSAVLLGLIYRFHAVSGKASTPAQSDKKKPLLFRALQAMHRARLSDGRPFGMLMGDAVHSALQMMLMIGGFLIVFSVMIQLLGALNLTQLLSTATAILLAPLGLPADFSTPMIAGLFEVTLGAKAASEVSSQYSLMWKAAIASAIISWGGLSVHAQVASILSKTDIRVAPYLIARILHAVLAAVLTVLLWKPLITATSRWTDSKPVFQPMQSIGDVGTWTSSLSHSGLAAFGILLLLLAFSFLFSRTTGKSRH